MMDFLSAMAIRNDVTADDIAYGREMIDLTQPEWKQYLPMLNMHARELRGRDTNLNVAKYIELIKQGKLVIIVARRKDNGQAVGYSIHVWYDELHYGLRVAEDEAWFVFPQFRRLGIGRRLREIALEELRKLGVQIALARTKVGAPHDDLMPQLGYHRYEIVYRKDLVSPCPLRE
jgi:GNAT superfamily N-acetyltransferase